LLTREINPSEFLYNPTLQGGAEAKTILGFGPRFSTRGERSYVGGWEQEFKKR